MLALMEGNSLNSSSTPAASKTNALCDSVQKEGTIDKFGTERSRKNSRVRWEDEVGGQIERSPHRDANAEGEDEARPHGPEPLSHQPLTPIEIAVTEQVPCV